MFKRLIELMALLALVGQPAQAAPDLVVPAPTPSRAPDAASAKPDAAGSARLETAKRLAQGAWPLRHVDEGFAAAFIGDEHSSIGLVQPQVAFGLRVPLVPLGEQASVWLDPMISFSGRASVSPQGGSEGEITTRVPLYVGVGVGPLQALEPTQRWSLGVGAGLALNNAWFAASGESLRWVAPSAELRAGLVPKRPLFEGRLGMKAIQMVELFVTADAPVTRDDVHYTSFSVGVHVQQHYPR